MCCRYNAIDVPLVQGLLEILGTTYASNPDGSGYRPSPKCSTFNTRLGSLEPVHSGKGGFTHIGPSSRPAASMNRPERKKGHKQSATTSTLRASTVMLKPKDFNMWLDPHLTNTDLLHHLLKISIKSPCWWGQ